MTSFYRTNRSVSAGTLVIAVGLLALSLHQSSAGATTAAVVPSISKPLTFIDYFNSGRMDGWTVHDEGSVSAPSKWAVRNHQLYQTSNIYGGSLAKSDISKPGTNVVAGKSTWMNYDFSARVRPFDNDAVGIVFRYRDKNNYYRFSMDKERGYSRLVKKVNGVYTLLARNSLGYETDMSYKLRAVAVGQQIEVLVNDRTIFSVRDASLAAGKFGLYTWGSDRTIFDSVAAQVENNDFFTVAVVPDTQNEASGYPAMLEAQMRYLAVSRADLNLAMVLQEGDVVNVAAQSQQWTTASTYYRYLSSKVPFVVAAGNHDLFQYTEPNPHTVNPARFNNFISGLSNYSISGAKVAGDYRNTYYLFSAGGVDMMVLNLEFGAGDDVLAWASQIVRAHPTRHVLMLTHDYLSEKNALRGSDGSDQHLPTSYRGDLNNGIDMWHKFVAQNPNVQFVFNGHVIAKTNGTLPYSVGHLVAENNAGRSVFQTLTNFQTYNNGNGYLRLFKFYPAQSKVDVTTYSPYAHTSLTDPLNQFTYNGVDLGSWKVP